MKKSDKKLISRGIDGELDERARSRLNQLLASDPDFAALDAGWRDVGDRLRLDAAKIQAPDPDVAWRDIQRAIRQQEDESFTAAGMVFPWRMKWAGALAALTVMGLFGWSASRLVYHPVELAERSESAADRVEWVVAEMPGATTMIYTDMETDMTVIWMDVAADVDPRDT